VIASRKILNRAQAIKHQPAIAGYNQLSNPNVTSSRNPSTPFGSAARKINTKVS
jgi:hypothetical protein